MSIRLYVVLLLAVVGLGGFLRFVDLGGPSLWHDEIVHRAAAEKLQSQRWLGLLSGFKEVEGRTENGPIYYLFEAIGMNLDPSDAGVRIFPAVFGLLALPMMALTGFTLGGRGLSLVVALLLALSPLHVYYSREGRPYSLLMLLALVLIWALLAESSSWRVWIVYITCLVAALTAVHCIPILVSFGCLSAIFLVLDLGRAQREGASAMVTLFRSPYANYTMAALLGVGLAVALYLTRSQGNWVDFEGGQAPVYISPLSRGALQRFAISLTTSGHQSGPLIWRSWIYLALALLGVGFGWRFLRRKTLAITAMFVLTSTLSIAALVAVGRWYGLRYTTPALPAFLLLTGLGVMALARLSSRALGADPWAKHAILAATVLLLTLPNLKAARTDSYEKLDWRGVATFLERIALDNEPVVVANAWPRICLGYYLRDATFAPRFIDVRESVELAERVVETHDRGWLVTAGFRASGDVRAWMHRFQPVLKDPREELAIFFFPDFPTLLETRYAAGRGAIFEEHFAALGGRFEFAGAEMMLQGRGWSFHESNREGITYQWAMGRTAELGLPIARRQQARLRLRVLPFSYPGATAQSVVLRLNHRVLATLELPQAWSELEVEVPEDAWDVGANILYLDFARTTVPATVIQGSRDRRSLSVAFDYLELLTGDRTGPG